MSTTAADRTLPAAPIAPWLGEAWLNEGIPPATLTVEVTVDDVRQGRANNCYLCPLNRALERHFPAPSGYSWRSDIGQASLHSPTTDAVVYRYSARLAVAVNSFDMGIVGGPTDFPGRFDLLLQDYAG